MYIRQLSKEDFRRAVRDIDLYAYKSTFDAKYKADINVNAARYQLEFRLLGKQKIAVIQANVMEQAGSSHRLIIDPPLLGALLEIMFDRFKVLREAHDETVRK